MLIFILSKVLFMRELNINIKRCNIVLCIFVKFCLSLVVNLVLDWKWREIVI